MTTNYDQLFSAHELIEIGDLHLPSGLVVACDPYFCSSATAFVRRVKPGTYPVQLCRVASKDFGPRIALARVVLNPHARATSFEKAVTAEPEAAGYIVNSGTGSFMDEESRAVFSAVLAEFYRTHSQGNYYTDVLEQEFQKNATAPDDIGAWALHSLPDPRYNVAMFSSGLGDGMFESFWGIAEDGEVTCLVTDFRVL